MNYFLNSLSSAGGTLLAFAICWLIWVRPILNRYNGTYKECLDTIIRMMGTYQQDRSDDLELRHKTLETLQTLTQVLAKENHRDTGRRFP